MFSFFRNKKIEYPEGYFPISTDIHSHILPGIDDGSPDIESSIRLINGLIDLGITKSVATPHIIGDLYKNNKTTINNSLNLLKAELEKRSIQFDLSAAAEYMLDTYFFELIQNDEPLLTIKDNIILTEFSYVSAPNEINKISFDIINAGYRPILAHPERYSYFHDNLKIYNKLNDFGFSLQVNLLSLAGYYGKNSMKAAQYMLDNNIVAYVATDLHHPMHLQLLSDKKSIEKFYTLLSHRTWNDF